MKYKNNKHSAKLPDKKPLKNNKSRALVINYKSSKSDDHHRKFLSLKQEIIVIGLLMISAGLYSLLHLKGIINQNQLVINFSPVALSLFGIILIALAYWEKES